MNVGRIRGIAGSLILLLAGYWAGGQTLPPPPPAVERWWGDLTSGDPARVQNAVVQDVLVAALFEELLLENLDAHFGEAYFDLMTRTGALLPSALQPDNFGVPNPTFVDWNDELQRAITEANTQFLIDFANFLAVQAPITATRWAEAAPLFVQDLVLTAGLEAMRNIQYRRELLDYGKDSLLGGVTNRLQLWLRADALTGSLPDGATVSTWADSSGSGRVVASPAGRTPRLKHQGTGGHPSVEFDDAENTASQYFEVQLPQSLRDNSFTVFAVFQSRLSAGMDILLTCLNTGWEAAWAPTLYVHQEATRGIEVVGQFNNFFMIGENYRPTDWIAQSLVLDSRNSQLMMFRNGVPDAGTEGSWRGQVPGGNLIGEELPANLTQQPSLDLWRIGAWWRGNEGFSGELSELMIFEGALGGAERAAVEEYLSRKYGLPGFRSVVRDTFNSPDANDLSADIATRQSGALAPVRYRGDTDQSVVKNGQVAIRNRHSEQAGSFYSVTPAMDFRPLEVEGSFRLRFRVAIDGLILNDTWVAVKLRSAAPNQPVNSPDGFGFLFRSGGPAEFFDGDTFIGTPNIFFLSAAAEYYDVDVVVKNHLCRIYINGQLVQLVKDGVLGPVEYSLGRHDLGNYITFASYAGPNALGPEGRFDDFDFSVDSLAPPPIDDQLILSDSFDGAVPDLNQGLDSRQAGDRATVRYQVKGSSASARAEIRNQKLALLAPAGQQVLVSPQHDFATAESSQTFRIMVRLEPGAGQAGIRFRDSDPLQGITEGTGLGLLFQTNGTMQIFEGGVLASTRAILPADSFELDIRSFEQRMLIYVNDLPLVFPDGQVYRTPIFGKNHITFSASAPAGAPAEVRVDSLRIGTFGPIPPPPEVPAVRISRYFDLGVRISWPPGDGGLEWAESVSGPWDLSPLQVEFDPDTGEFFAIDFIEGTQRYYRLFAP